MESPATQPHATPGASGMRWRASFPVPEELGALAILPDVYVARTS